MKTMMIIETTHGGLLFSLTYMAAFLVAGAIVIIQGMKKGYPLGSWLLIIATGVMFFVIGNKALTYTPEQWGQVFTRFCFPVADKKSVLGGIAGLVAGLILAKACLRFNWSVFDTISVALPLAMAISRIGCLFAGCCFGTPTNLPWGVQYDSTSWAYHVQSVRGLVHSHDALSLAVHPAQLYQVVGCVVIAFVVWRSRKYWRSEGSMFLFSVLCYGALRFVVEFVRAPETNFHTGLFFLGLKIIQWMIICAWVPVLFLLIYRESKAEKISMVTQPDPVSQLRQVMLTIFLLVLLFLGRHWFTVVETLTIFLFLMPVLMNMAIHANRMVSVPGFRWVVPVMLACSAGFMAQRSIPSLKEGETAIFTDAGITGLFGTYYEDISRAVKTSHPCGTDVHLEPVGTQKKTFYQAGLDISHNVWKGKYYKYTIGARAFLGFESGGVVTDYPHSQISAGVSPYLGMDWQNFGFKTGLLLGQSKFLAQRPASSYDHFNDGDIVSPDYINVYCLPSVSVRAGPIDILYAEATFPGLFPSATPYPLFQAGIGTGLGKTDGTKLGAGYCHEGIYAQCAIPIKNIVVLEAFYGDNLQTGEDGKRVFLFGAHFRFLEEIKTTPNDYSTKMIPGLPAGTFTKLKNVLSDIDGNVYHTLAIGGQVWMAEDLRTLRYKNGSRIAGVTTTGPESGTLYRWKAVIDSSKICPSGWHVPSAGEWTSLINSLGGVSHAVNALKESFSDNEKSCQWWSSTEEDPKTSKCFYLDNMTDVIMLTGIDKNAGSLVRCLRDY